MFIFGTIYNLTYEVSDESWLLFWRIYLAINVVLSAVVIVWFVIGGFRDLGRMNRRLKSASRDSRDDGFVSDRGQQSNT